MRDLPLPQAPRRRLSRRGFTLIELGIVIGVTAILAAAIVPDVIETMRNRMAEKAAVDVVALHDAARLFFAQNTTNGTRRWPGESSAGLCATSWTFDRFKNEMLGQGYLAGGGNPANPFAGLSPNFMMNPWSRPYEVSLYAPTGTTTPGCLFGVTTIVPESVAESFISFLPQATCGGACGAAAPAGWKRCCSFAAKPSAGLLQACGVHRVQRDNQTGALSCP